MEDDNPKEIFWVLSVIGVVEKRRTRECTIYKHGPSRLLLRSPARVQEQLQEGDDRVVRPGLSPTFP